MSKYRTAYAPEFRQQLVELVHAGRSANDVAKEFGLHATTVAKWCAAAQSRQRPRLSSKYGRCS